MNTPYFKVCPSCGSDDVEGNRARNRARCLACGYPDEERGRGGHYSPAMRPEHAAFCRELSARVNWVEAVFESWPGPVAHEAFQLKTLLDDGQILGALWQLKDLAEVLLKLPAVIMARDLLENGKDASLESRIWKALTSKPLSMGDWHALAGDLLAREVINRWDEGLVLPEVARVFRKSASRTTPAYRALKELIPLRNQTIGHGAFNPDMAAYRRDLSTWVPRVNDEVLAAIQEAGVWEGVSLRVHEEPDTVLIGAGSIRERHDLQEPGPHLPVDREVELVRDDRALSLSPLLAVKCCTVCRKADVFFFDSRQSGEARERFFFLDYLAGHKMSRPGHLEPGLAKRGEEQDTEGGRTVEAERSRMASRRMQRLLEETSLKARYLSPGFLRDRLRGFLDARSRGVAWLRAPAHWGKSVFVQGLQPDAGLEKDPLADDLRVAVFPIKREFRFTPVQLKGVLREALAREACLDVAPGNEPDLDLSRSDPAKAFGAWLGAFLTASPCDPETRLLVCLDGLDELSPSNEKGLLDFIPHPDDLPERCYLLLTSRPEAESPAWVVRTMEGHFDPLQEDCEIWVFGLEDADYLSLLEAYFFQGVHDRLVEAWSREMQAWVSSGEAAGLISDIPDRMSRPDLARAAKRTWREVLEEAGISETQSGPSQGSLCARLVNPVLEAFEGLFEQVLEKADRRFLYVSHLTNLLELRAISLEDVPGLPPAERLFTHYLDELERVLPPKLWDLCRQVILILAAAEEAHARDATLRDREAPVWQGLPLEVLAGLLGEEGPREARLIFCLYSIKEVLGTWRGDASAEPFFRLGLKDMAVTVREAWREDLERVHRNLAEGFYRTWKGRFEEVPYEGTEEYLLRMVPEHADLSGDEDLKEIVWSDEGLAGAYLDRGNHYYGKRSLYQLAATWFETAVLIYAHLVGAQGRQDLANSLAAAYMNRGVAFDSQGRYEEAIGDYTRAIGLREGLVFDSDFAQAIPGACMAHFNLLVLEVQGGDPDSLSIALSRCQAFLEKLESLVDISKLPEPWRKEVEDLRSLMERTKSS